jgi:hypothetical protein
MKKNLLSKCKSLFAIQSNKKNTTRFNGLLTLFIMVMFGGNVMGQTLLDSYTDGDFTASPVWGGNTSLWAIQANSDAAAGATGSNTLRLATSGTSTDYLSTQVSSWGTSQEWGFWVGRRAQQFSAANQMYIWLYANEATLNNATVDGYRIAIGDDSGGDDIRLEYVVNGAVSSTVIASAGSLSNGLTDIGFLIRVTRSSVGGWEVFTSTLPTANATGAIASTVPNSTNAPTSGGTGTNSSLALSSNGYFGVAALHSSGANALAAVEFDQIYFTPATSATINVGTLSEFTTSATSTPSVEQTLIVSGTSLSNDITITPPTGFEISLTTGGSFVATNPITITSASANAGNTNIYVRYNPASLAVQPQVAGTNISLVSTGASTQNVTLLGSVRNLSQGDFALIGFNASTTDALSFVALTSIPANTIIKFTDNGYSDTTTQMLTEGYLIYTAPSTISAGTVVSWNNGMNISGTGWNSNAPTNFTLNASGEQLFAYQGTWGVGGGTTTLHQGFMTGGTWTISGSVASVTANSYLPTGLTTGTSAADFANANAYYTNNTTNTINSKTTIFTRSSTAANWTSSDSQITPVPSWTFNIIAEEPTTQPSFSAATSVGNNQMDLNFTGGNGTSYMVVMREGSAVTATPTDATNYSSVSGSVNFSTATELSAGQRIVYNGTTATGTVTVTNLSPGTTYHYAIYAYNGTTTTANFHLTSPGTGNQLTTGIANSNVSDIIIHASFTEPSNIDYASTQENSNLTVGTSVELAQFTLRDGGATTDADANSTTLNAITFTITNHTNLRRLALYDGSTELSEVAISSGTATFSGLTLAAGDNSAKDFSLRASFAGTVTDNAQFSFTVSSATADVAGSTFATADAGAAASSTTGDRNKIEVTADRLTFVQQPSNVSVNTAMSPAPTVSANDALANRDLDYVTNMTATTTGTFGSSTNLVTPVAGLGTFSNLQFSAATTGRTIEVTSGSLTASGNSSTFDITASIGAGDIAFIKYQSDAPDEFSIITFVDIPASQTFYFTDNQWTTESGPLAINEQTMTWTTPGTVIPAGTVITFSNPSGSTTTVTPSGNGIGTNALNGISASGDQIFMYKGSSGSPSQFICGLNFGNSGAWQTSAGIDSSISFLPADLTNNVNAISFASDLDNGYYGNTMAGSISTLKSLINNGANWTRSNSLQTPPTWSFTVNAITTTLTANATVQNLALASDETFIVGVNTLTINGSMTGSGTLAGSATSNLVITGASGTIAFDQTTPGTTNVLKNLTISGSGTTTLGNALNITAGSSSGIVTVGSGATLTTGGFLTLKSDATGTASLGNSAGTISGNVTVERFIPNKRAWRALTAPLKGSVSDASIFSQWQNNGDTVANTGVELWGPAGDTTPSSNNSGLKVGPNSSILQYVSGAWSGVTNTNDTKLFTTDRNNAFMVFPTGPYNSGLISSSLPAEPTTLKATGQLITGEVTYSNIPTTSHTLIGNPYASPINLNSILDASTTLEKYFWVWDPNGANQGAYNMFDADANSYTVTNLSYTNSTVIQSGQAFFVKALSGQTGSFTISESNKSTASTNNVFRNNNPAELLRVGLYKQENNEWSGRDGAMTVILPDANANQTPNKMANGTENVAFVKNGSLFASEHHLPLVASDVLNIRVWRTTAGANYKLKINTEQFASTNLNATLEDLFTNSRTPLNLEGTAVEYPFTVTNDALSTGDRFRIVFQNAVLGTINPTATGFSIVPNPVIGDSFQVNLGTLATGKYSYSICNAIGQEVEKGSFQNATQNTNYTIKFRESAATGIYIMKIKGSDNTVITAKLIKK